MTKGKLFAPTVPVLCADRRRSTKWNSGKHSYYIFCMYACIKSGSRAQLWYRVWKNKFQFFFLSVVRKHYCQFSVNNTKNFNQKTVFVRYLQTSENKRIDLNRHRIRWKEVDRPPWRFSTSKYQLIYIGVPYTEYKEKKSLLKIK